MKKITLLTVCTLIIRVAFSQGYLDSTSTWNQQSGYFDGVNENHSQYYKLTINGDTIISGKTYHKILKTGIDTVYYWNTGNTVAIPINEYYCSLREDSSKFYIVYKYQTNEYLQYDFNLNVGDTLFNFVGVQGCSPPSIIGIDTVFLGMNPRKRFHLVGSSVFFIEGVGASSGLTGQFCQFIESGGILICFGQNNGNLIVDSSLTCDIALNIQQEKSQFLKMNVYPNPFSWTTTIKLENNKHDTYSLTIFNTLGQVSRHIDNITTNEVTIEKENLQKGIYFFQINSKDEIIGKAKIIIE